MEPPQKNTGEESAARGAVAGVRADAVTLPSDPPPSSAVSALEEYKAAHHGKAPPMTRGEKAFNALDYYGIGLGVNTAVSMFMFDQFFHKHLQPLKNFLDKNEGSLGGRLAKLGMLGSGGFILLIPMKLMEDHKDWWVRKLDTLFHRQQLSETEKQDIEARYEYLKQEPKQTYASEFWARVISWVINYGFYEAAKGDKKIPGSKGLEPLTEKWGNETGTFLRDAQNNPNLAKMTSALESKLEVSAAPGWIEKSKREFHKASGKKRLDNLIEGGYLELILTATMSTLQFAWSRLLAPFLGKKADDGPTAVSPTVSSSHGNITVASPTQSSPPTRTAAISSPPGTPDTRISQPDLHSMKKAEKNPAASASLMDRVTQPDAAVSIHV